MAVIEAALYAADDPNGSPLATITDGDFEVFNIRKAQNSLGGGEIRIARSHAAATAANLAGGNLVKVTIPVIDSDPIWAFWLDDADDTILATGEEGAEIVARIGQGPIAILRRAALLDDFFNGPLGGLFRGNTSEPGFWTWTNQPYGAILVRLIEEGQLQPGLPLDDVTIDFTRTHDSNGDAWPDFIETVQIDIGTDGLTVYERLIASGNLFVQADPDLSIHAFGTQPGTDRSSATFASGKVRFEKGVNIETELVRSAAGTQAATHAIVRGKDFVYRRVVAPGWSSGDPARWIAVDYPESNDPDLLDAVGLQELARRLSLLDAFEFEILPGDNEAAGRYLPFKHFDVGDTVRVHTGSGLSDYDEVDVPIVGIRIEVGKATDDSTPELAAKSLRVVVELGGRESIGHLGTGGVSARKVSVEDPFFVYDPLSILTSPPDRTLRLRDLGSERYKIIASSDGDEDQEAFVLFDNRALLLNLFDVLSDDFSAVELFNTGVFIEGRQVVIESTGTGNSSKVVLDSNVGVVIADLAADPDGAHSEEGQIYWNDVDKVFRVYDGTTWEDVLTSASPVTPFTPTMITAECFASLPVGNSDFDFDTFYGVDQTDLSGLIPASLGLSYAGTSFTADEDGVWAINISVDLTAAPGEAGQIRLTTDAYSLAPEWYVDPAQPAGRRWTAHWVVALRTGWTFQLLHAMPTVQAADYASLDITRLAAAVQ